MIRQRGAAGSLAGCVLAAAGLCAVPAQSAAEPLPPQIHTVAGGGSCSGAVTSLGICDNVAATSVPILGARSIAALPDGSYLFVDEGDDLVREVSPSGKVTTVAGTATPVMNGQPLQTVPDMTDVEGVPATSSGLDDPVAVAPLPDGGFLITEFAGCRVRMVSPGPPGEATITTIAGNPPPAGTPPAANPSPCGNNGASAAGTSTDLQEPSDAIPTANGGVLIADTFNDRILLLSSADPSAAVQEVAGGGSCNDAVSSCQGLPASQVALDQPDSISEMASGAYLVSEFGDSAVREISAESPAGTFTTVAGVPGSPGYSGDGGFAGGARLNQPEGVAATPDGGFLIADTHNNVVRQVSPNGVISTIAGNGTIGSTGDGGAATAAQLNGPVGVAETPSGGILIADENNGAIREITQPSATLIELVPFHPNGHNGWYKTDPQLFVTANENATLSCVLDPGQPPPAFGAIAPGCAYAGGALVRTDGAHTIYAASENSFGDQENPVSLTFKIDATPPKITCGAAAGAKEPVFTYGQSGAAVPGILTDSVSGPASVAVLAHPSTLSLGGHQASVRGSNLAGVSKTVKCPYFVRALSFTSLPGARAEVTAAPAADTDETKTGASKAGTRRTGAHKAGAPKLVIVKQMVVTAVPANASVAVECRGTHCPFGGWRRVMSARPKSKSKKEPAKPRDATLTRLFAGKPLRYGTSVIASLTAPKTIGRYVRFTITSGKKGPRAALSAGCMPPGAPGPSSKPCAPKLPGQTPTSGG